METSSKDVEQAGAEREDVKSPTPLNEKPDVGVSSLLPTWQPSQALVRHVVRKIDMILIPLMCGCVFLQMSDKMLLNSVSLLGFMSDIHLENQQQFSWISSIFYFGYLLGAFLHAYFIQHWVLSQYVSAVVTLWGVLVACHAACHSYGAFLAVRFFLGFMEAAITPSFIMMTGRFYTRAEQTIRMNIWFAMNGVAQIVAGAATYSELIHTPSTMTMWQNLFLIYGVITFAFGILCFFLMPSSPDTTHYFNEEERGAAVYHIAANQSGIHDSHFKWPQFREALLDIRLYIYFLGWVCLCIVNGGITTFGNQIIQSFHYSSKQSSLLSMSIGGGEVVSVYLGAFLFYLLKRRDVVMIFGLLVSMAGAIMMVAIPASAKAGRMTGTTKRIVFNVSLQIGYSVGNIIGPHTFDNSFTAGETVMVVLLFITMLFIVSVSVIHWFMNREKDRKYPSHDMGNMTLQMKLDLSDLTDKERPTYRYPY